MILSGMSEEWGWRARKGMGKDAQRFERGKSAGRTRNGFMESLWYRDGYLSVGERSAVVERLESPKY